MYANSGSSYAHNDAAARMSVHQSNCELFKPILRPIRNIHAYKYLVFIYPDNRTRKRVRD